MLDDIIQDIYISKQLKEEFEDLEEDKEVVSTEEKILQLIDEDDSSQALDLLIHLESRMMKLAYKKGFVDGMQFMTEVKDKAAGNDKK